MFINDINPVLTTIGPFEIRYYGIIYALGFLIGYFFLRARIKQKKTKLTFELLDLYFFWLIIGVIVGARIFEVIFFNLKYYMLNPAEIFMIWHGGLSFHGGLFGAIIVTYIFCKKNKIDFYDIADSLVIPASLALFFGRIANFLNSEHYGKITDSLKTSWCVVYKRVDNFCRHPSQIYEGITNLVTFFILYYYDHVTGKSRLHYKKGTLFWLFISLYGFFRFLVNFYRDDPQYQFFLGISTGQWFSLLMFIVGIIFLYKINRKK